MNFSQPGNDKRRAEKALALAAADPRIPHGVKEDGCFERANAARLTVQKQLEIADQDIGTIFYLNPGSDPQAVLTAPNPSPEADIKRLKHFLMSYAALSSMR